ncbi:hypothetical protein F511_23046 [Dorcoceras hygrometricum]|uniref:Uncharacterized protein n=1 Tax=Dorcoceras hygrometricum TaxID=472368 RepID=A0A2Z7CAB2_9LAMI|nr:hypothetical protein F511_23046 [Dorcoceras hygrometricum]
MDRIGGSTAAYSLKCRFPRETGRSQAPRRQQEQIAGLLSVVEVLGVLAACGLLDRVRTGAAVIKSSSGILPEQGIRGY